LASFLTYLGLPFGNLNLPFSNRRCYKILPAGIPSKTADAESRAESQETMAKSSTLHAMLQSLQYRLQILDPVRRRLD